MMGLDDITRQLYERVQYLAQVVWATNPRIDPPAGLDALAQEMEGALGLVRPPEDFRQRLGNNLALAAQRRMSGMAIEPPRPFRGGIIYGVSAGLVATIAIILVLVLRVRPHSQRS